MAAVFVDPVMHALYGYTESLRDLSDLVTSIWQLGLAHNCKKSLHPTKTPKQVSGDKKDIKNRMIKNF